MALSTHTRPSSTPPSIWLTKTMEEFQELDRLIALNGALSGKGPSRIPVFEMIPPDAWLRIRENRNRAISTLLNISTDLPKEEYLKAASSVNEFVDQYLDRFLTNDPKSIAKFRADLLTIQASPPADKTQRGNCGPTFMISFPRWELDGESRVDQGVVCVLKYTDPYEVIGHRFLEAVATGFTMQRNVYNEEFFWVPQMTAFDLSANQIRDIREHQPLDNNTAIKLRQIFSNFIENYHLSPPMQPSHKTTVIRLEKIQGQNLPEFLLSHYDNLSKKVKMSLFRRLGRIAYLDLVIGNNDRLITFDPKTLIFSNEEANLGNLMASRSTNGINLFAIDNGMNIYLCDPEQQASYLSFLKNIFSSPKFEEILAIQIKIAIIEALKDVEHLDSFKKDLETEGLIQVRNGIKKMEEIMISQISPAWNSSALKLDLSSINLHAANALDARIQLVVDTVKEDQKKAAESDCEIPMLRRHTPDPTTKEPSNRESSLLNLIWSIHQRLRGSLEDEAFFRSLSIPQEHEDSEINLIFQHCRQIQANGINPEILTLLRDLTQKASQKYGISLTSESPLILAADPTPSSSDRTSNDTPPIVARAQSLDRKTDPTDSKTS